MVPGARLRVNADMAMRLRSVFVPTVRGVKREDISVIKDDARVIDLYGSRYVGLGFYMASVTAWGRYYQI